MQNYFFGIADNSKNRSFLFLDNFFGVTPDNFLISFIKCVWSVKLKSGNNLPFLISCREDLNLKILQYAFKEIPKV